MYCCVGNSDLHGGLVGLSFDSEWLPDPKSWHVGQTATLTVHTPTHTVILSVFGLNTHTQIQTTDFSTTHTLNKVLLLLPHLLTLSDVRTRMVEAPQFWINVRGITSSAWATARYGHCSTPVRARERSVRCFDTAISTAPPPGNRKGSSNTLRHTCMASCRFLSTSCGQWDSVNQSLDLPITSLTDWLIDHRSPPRSPCLPPSARWCRLWGLCTQWWRWSTHLRSSSPQTAQLQRPCPPHAARPSDSQSGRRTPWERNSYLQLTKTSCLRSRTLIGCCVPCNAVIISLPDATDGGDVSFHQVMLSEIWQETGSKCYAVILFQALTSEDFPFMFVHHLGALHQLHTPLSQLSCSWHVPEIPFSVKSKSGLRRMMSSQICWMYSSSICRIRAKSSSLLISISVCRGRSHRQTLTQVTHIRKQV